MTTLKSSLTLEIVCGICNDHANISCPCALVLVLIPLFNNLFISFIVNLSYTYVTFIIISSFRYSAAIDQDILFSCFQVSVILVACTIWDAYWAFSASLATRAALWAQVMLAVLSIWAAPRAVPALLAILTVQAAPEAVPRFSAMLALLIELPELSLESLVWLGALVILCILQLLLLQSCFAMNVVFVRRIIWFH